MVGASILEAVENLEAGTIAKRNEGLDDLRRILTNSDSVSKLQTLGDDGWHKILEVLFGIVQSDKHDLLGGSATAKKRAANRLDTVAAALKLVVTSCHLSIKPKTAHAILDHISGHLNYNNENEEIFRRSIQSEYLKSFRLLLSNEAHGEHLRASHWQRFTDFVLNAVNANLASLDDADEDDDDVLSVSKGYSVNGSMRSTIAVRTSQNSSARAAQRHTAQLMDDLLLTLRDLSNITNGPLQTRLTEIAQTVLKILTMPLQARDAAFECLNHVLLLARTEDMMLVTHIAGQIIPVIRKLWSYKVDHKSTSLQEQMLITLLLIEESLRSNETPASEDNAHDIEELARHMLEEYGGRTAKYCLQIADLNFARSTKDDFFSRMGIMPDLDSTSSILKWTTVSMIARLRSSTQMKALLNEGRVVEKERPRKRQKSSLVFPDLVRLLFIPVADLREQEIRDFMDEHLSGLTDDRAGRTSWVLLVIARLCRTKSSKAAELVPYWLRAWTAASQLVASTTNSRAACFTLMCILEADVVSELPSNSRILDFCFHNGSIGPPSLTDAAMLLFASCLRSKFLNTKRQFKEFQEKVLSWLDVVWSIPTARDFARSVDMARMGRTIVVHDLLMALTGSQNLASEESWTYPPNPIYHAHLRMKEDTEFTQFVYGLSSHEASQEPKTPLQLTSHKECLHIDHSSSNTIISEFMDKKLHDLEAAFREIEFIDCEEKSAEQIKHKRRANLTINMAEIITTACTVAASVLDDQVARNGIEEISYVWKCVLDYVELQSHDDTNFETALSCITRRLLDVRPFDEKKQFIQALKRQPLVKSLQTVLSNRRIGHSVDSDMDMDFVTQTMNSQQSQSKSQKSHQDIVRRELRLCVGYRSMFIRSQFLLLKESLETSLAQQVPLASAITTFVLSLGAEDLLATSSVLIDWLDGNRAITPSDAARLLHRIAEVCLQAEEHERNEAALCFSLKALRSVMHLWLQTDDEDLSDIAYDVYSWFITIVGKGVLSAKVLFNIAALLDSLIRLQPTYGLEDLPSPRTSLLRILQIASSSLKFRLVSSLAKLFEGYVLSEHTAIFDDVVDCLPTDRDYKEGIGVRLYILAKLGSNWRTVLRQATYHIFETAANVPSAMLIAGRALRMISNEIGLSSNQSTILSLFAPQLFFTWLGDGAIETIPFAAFNYGSLRELVAAEVGELVAQTTLRMNKRQQEVIQNMIGTPWSVLLQSNFSKSQSYALAADIVDHRAGPDTGPVEAALKNQLGDEQYQNLTKFHFPSTIAHVILSISDDRGFEKVLSSSNRYKALSQAYDSIIERGHSSAHVPARQQPSFRPKYLMQILSKLALKAHVDPDSFWSPALLALVYRKLLDDAEPALGPLHVASVIRKLRVAVVLGGPVSLKGYPLEILLHRLRPYLTRFHCAEDAIGIFWYLLEYGKRYLEKSLSFLTGLGVAIFTSLAVFANSSQESTTQESQFVSTMSKAKSFKTWLGKYLRGCKNERLKDDHQSRYQHIIENSERCSSSGTNSRHEPEGILLYYVLLDRGTVDPLLNTEFFHIVITSLSQQFRLAENPSDDILTDEDDIVKGASILWPILEERELSTAFKVWAGTVIGRAYSIKGPKLELNTFSSLESTEEYSDVPFQPWDSYRRVLSLLSRGLWGEDTRGASISEQTISFVLSSLPKNDRARIFSGKLEWRTLEDLMLDPPQSPGAQMGQPDLDITSFENIGAFADEKEWASALATLVISEESSDVLLSGLLPLLRTQHSIAALALPAIVHFVLNRQADSQNHNARNIVSKVFETVLTDETLASQKIAHLVLNVITYLRKCIYPRETTLAQRNRWLLFDYGKAAAAALRCDLPKTALLMLEIENSEQRLQSTRSRRSSIVSEPVANQLLSRVFQSLDDEDFFYGAQHQANIESVLTRLKHEGQGNQALAVQSALFDAKIRIHGPETVLQSNGKDMVDVLSLANLSGLAYATQQYVGGNTTEDCSTSFGQSSLNIQQWDVVSPESDSKAFGAVSAILSKISTIQSKPELNTVVFTGICDAASMAIKHSHNQVKDASGLTTLAALSEIHQIVTATSSEELDKTWEHILGRRNWADTESFDSVSSILVVREAASAAMRRNERASELFFSSSAELLLYEIQTVRTSLSIGSKQDAAQFALNRAVHLTELQKAATNIDLDVESAITFDVANTLWSQGEISAPIEMLRSLQNLKSRSKSALVISKAELLTDLGQKLSQARLDRPDEVTTHYLQPAIEALKDAKSGTLVGRVHHNFAAFCDEQLQDQVGKDDFERISKIRYRKLQEVDELAEICRRVTGQEREKVKNAYAKAKNWFKLDDEEFKRLKGHREGLLQKSLEHYLRSMAACDEYGKDVLRFMSLWLGNSEVPEANAAVRSNINAVPSLKLTPFVNQLCSRLAENTDLFQHVLFDMLFRICCDHPYHSLYQLFAVCKSKGAPNDPVAASRHEAATRLSKDVQKKGQVSANIWISIHNSSIYFVGFAQERQDKDAKTGSKIPIHNFKSGVKLEQTMQALSHKIPPPTMNVPLQSDKDYSTVSTFVAFEPHVSLAGGVSAPKIATVIATDGFRYKMLLKGGNDDLRQDAIMEQVFAQVSDLLQDHRPTRQRNIGIRTYKVIPLTHNAGIIEFVQNTVPLHEYLLPAHARYYAKDYKANQCRRAIGDAQSRTPEERLKAYRIVTQNFHPVMRFFFMENFPDPEDWFDKRLSYSRSSAAISMLGHVLGLGDRHGHNILLDQKTGEVVHIDLGVAFEAGRVLPVPEVVPFRLTRDLVDGMGISGVEGPFRRCCNFTLEALRKNEDAIMTILDVLRWDPLYSWSVSPLRVRRIQDQQEREAAIATSTSSIKNENRPTPDPDIGTAEATTSNRNEERAKTGTNISEPGEADRALAVVAKKLSASLSVEATVNELIRQATDERNLAVLYCGWAAYA